MLPIESRVSEHLGRAGDAARRADVSVDDRLSTDRRRQQTAFFWMMTG